MFTPECRTTLHRARRGRYGRSHAKKSETQRCATFIDERSHELHGIVGVRPKGGEGRGVDGLGVSALVDEVASFFDEQRDVSFAFLQQILERLVDDIDVFLIERGKLAHGAGLLADAVVEEFVE